MDLSNVARMVQTIMPYSNNVDVADESMPLSYYARNEVEVMDSNGATSLDEMSFNFLLSKPAFYKDIAITTIQDYDTVLWSETLAPGQFYQSFTDLTVPYRSYTPLGYISRFFTYWRGSIGFKLKFVKTEFHSARFVLSFAPYQTSHADWTVADTPYLFREIIDLRLGNEFTVIIPYTSIKPYRTVEVLEPYGKVCLHVLNQLKAPSTVSSTIHCLIEPFAGPDFEFAVPRTPDAQPYLPLSVAQMDMGGGGEECEIFESYIGGARPNEETLVPSRLCIGEKITSVLTLLKHASCVNPRSSAFSSVTSFRIVPRSLNVTSNDVSSLVGSVLKSDNFTFFVGMYAYQRGSVRCRGYYDPGTTKMLATKTGIVLPAATLINDYTTDAGTLATFAEPNTPLVFQATGFRGGYEVSAPFYNPTHVIPNQWMLSTGIGIGGIGSPLYTVPIQTITTRVNSASTLVTLSRQAGDDFQCFEFAGTLPLTGTNF